MKFQIIAITFCIWLFFPVLSKSQTAINNQSIGEVKRYPNLGADISKVAEFKIFNPRNVFHFEEVITIDIALLTSESEYYFPKNLNNNVNMVVKNNMGNKISIQPVFSSDEFIKFEKHKNALLKKSLRLLIGCNNNTLINLQKDYDLVNEDDVRDIFHKNLFWSLPDGCIDIADPTEIEINAEFSNDRVFINGKDQIQTAVGKIRSNTLKISIKKD